MGISGMFNIIFNSLLYKFVQGKAVNGSVHVSAAVQLGLIAQKYHPF